MKQHIVICGRRNSGKTTLVERLLAQCTLPVYGFRTKITHSDADGYHKIYMFPAGEPDGTLTEANHVGDCNTRNRTVNLQVFENLGVRLLQSVSEDGLILMDELGFMEAQAPVFCETVLNRLDGDIPVLATVKAQGIIETEFLTKVRNHSKATLYELIPDNREEIFQKILPTIHVWSQRKIL